METVTPTPEQENSTQEQDQPKETVELTIVQEDSVESKILYLSEKLVHDSSEFFEGVPLFLQTKADEGFKNHPLLYSRYALMANKIVEGLKKKSPKKDFKWKPYAHGTYELYLVHSHNEKLEEKLERDPELKWRVDINMTNAREKIRDAAEDKVVVNLVATGDDEKGILYMNHYVRKQLLEENPLLTFSGVKESLVININKNVKIE